MKRFTFLDIANVILAVLLFLCLAKMPYGYYTLVRFLTMVIMGCNAFVFYNKKNLLGAVVAVSVAILFQPFFKIYLGRDLWNIVDVIIALFLIGYTISIAYKKMKKTNHE